LSVINTYADEFIYLTDSEYDTMVLWEWITHTYSNGDVATFYHTNTSNDYVNYNWNIITLNWNYNDLSFTYYNGWLFFFEKNWNNFIFVWAQTSSTYDRQELYKLNWFERYTWMSVADQNNVAYNYDDTLKKVMVPTWSNCLWIWADSTWNYSWTWWNCWPSGQLWIMTNASSLVDTWPPPLTNAEIIEIISTDQGFNVQYMCEQDCVAWFSVSYTEGHIRITGTEAKTHSWSLDILEQDIVFSWSYQEWYNIEGIFIDVNDENNFIHDEITTQYWYDPDPEDYQIWDFTFSPFILNRLDNWIEILNLDVEPKGGVFLLDIIGPNGLDWAIHSQTVRIWNDQWEHDIYSTGYWSWSINIITYPYHRWAWDYNLTITYAYSSAEQVIYPYWLEALNYNISSPEWSEEDSELFICDVNDDWIVSETEKEQCTSQLEWNFIDNVWKFFAWIKKLFTEIMKLWNTPSKEWGFISQTYAGEMVSEDIIFNMNLDEDNILTDTYHFITWFIIFAFLILSIIIILLLVQKN
jgi:hypothetical protein